MADAHYGLQPVREQLAHIEIGRCSLFIPQDQVNLVVLEREEVVLWFQRLDAQLDPRGDLTQPLYQDR
ncbi:hypothetical protein D3C76_1369360 [compost metagenome]